MDVSIVGAWGDIGRQTAISLVQDRVLDQGSRLQLVGRRGGESERALAGFASDLSDAYAERIPELDVAFDAEEVIGDIIIFAAGATVPTDPRQRLPRRLLAEKNLPLFRHYADVIRRHGHGEEIILVVSNPVELGFDSPEGRERIARLQSAQAIEPDVALREIQITCCCLRDRCRSSRSRSSVRTAYAATSIDASSACPRWPERWSCAWRKETSGPSAESGLSGACRAGRPSPARRRPTGCSTRRHSTR